MLLLRWLAGSGSREPTSGPAREHIAGGLFDTDVGVFETKSGLAEGEWLVTLHMLTASWSDVWWPDDLIHRDADMVRCLPWRCSAIAKLR